MPRNKRMAESPGEATTRKPTRRNRPPKPGALTPEGLRQRVSLRPREYADLTGIPLPSVYRHISNGSLKSKRVGSSIRIAVEELR
jgi:excisionase family DNA binding protein